MTAIVWRCQHAVLPMMFLIALAACADRQAQHAATDVPPTVVERTVEPVAAPAADADVTFVRVVETAPDIYTFHVTVAHPDRGWEDYADGWDVVLPDGSAILPQPDARYTRPLLHPHVDEQPFTRSQSGLEIPSGIVTVTVRAHDLVDGYGGKMVTVDLRERAGVDFRVER